MAVLRAGDTYLTPILQLCVRDVSVTGGVSGLLVVAMVLTHPMETRFDPGRAGGLIPTDI